MCAAAVAAGFKSAACSHALLLLLAVPGLCHLSLFLPKWAHSSCSDSKRGKGEETTLRQQQGLQVQFRRPLP